MLVAIQPFLSNWAVFYCTRKVKKENLIENSSLNCAFQIKLASVIFMSLHSIDASKGQVCW